MSRTLSERTFLSSLLLETLEPRIAPAVVINVGAPNDLDPQNTTYNEAPFVKAKDSTDPGVAALFVGSDDHYVLALERGDRVRMFDPAQGYQDFVNVSGGRVLAFFFDKNPLDGGRVEAADLAGFATASGSRLAVAGSVDGDIVGNYNGATGLLSTTDLIADRTSITFLSIAGTINGSVITGGSLANLNIQGQVEQITTTTDGTYIYSFGGTGAAPGIGEATLSAYVPAANVAGSNITGVTVGGFDSITAGNGGDGARGGSISKVTVTSDFDGFSISAGDGGTGTRAGAGGAVSQVTVYGAADVVAGLITIEGGNGGTVVSGAGGAGGAVSSVFVGYQPSGNKLLQSPVALNDFVSVQAGNGGNGSTVGGVGGSLSNINIVTVVTDDPTPGVYEIEVVAGIGGNASAGRGGNGGSVNGTYAVNLNYLPGVSDQLFISGGNGGDGSRQGGIGGSVNSAELLADLVFARGGAGGDGGATGGAGGGISRLTLKSDLKTDLVDSFFFLAGAGGNATTGNAGAGGNIANITGDSLDFNSGGNVMAAGSGGTSVNGIGGRGGSLTSVNIFESVPVADNATTTFNAGAGGDGGRNGGVGGAITSLTFLGYSTLPVVAAGAGGASTIAGIGGAGGAITNLSLRVLDVNPLSGDLNVSAGHGGAGAGANGRGGAGGSINTASTLAGVTPANPFGPGLNVNVQAGDGGMGGAGTVGVGGSASRITVSSAQGGVLLQAGSAGAAGLAVRGANGGALTSVSASAFGGVQLLAGDGSLGGRGGNITTAAWYGINPALDFSPDTAVAPNGNILVEAGQGSVSSAPRGPAGLGGSLSNLSGHASAVGTTQIFAGDGNGGVAGQRAAAGGSITGLSIYGGSSFAEVRAGNGGSLAAAVTGNGAAGGNISGLNAAEGVNFQYLAAGDGGNSGAGVANGRGGVGGSVTNVNVFNDIGLRTGANFGIDGMGGIFAGVGGSGGASNLDGRAGNVTSVTAAAIASIVAGRPTVATPEALQLVNSVDRVFLRGIEAPTVDGAGGFTNFNSANFVGSIAGDPTLAGANDFKVDIGGIPTPVGVVNPYPWVLGTTKPIDGLVAAISLSLNTNFRPQAWLTVVDPSVSASGYALADYRNDFNTNS